MRHAGISAIADVRPLINKNPLKNLVTIASSKSTNKLFLFYGLKCEGIIPLFYYLFRPV